MTWPGWATAPFILTLQPFQQRVRDRATTKFRAAGRGLAKRGRATQNGAVRSMQSTKRVSSNTAQSRRIIRSGISDRRARTEAGAAQSKIPVVSRPDRDSITGCPRRAEQRLTKSPCRQPLELLLLCRPILAPSLHQGGRAITNLLQHVCGDWPVGSHGERRPARRAPESWGSGSRCHRRRGTEWHRRV